MSWWRKAAGTAARAVVSGVGDQLRPAIDKGVEYGTAVAAGHVTHDAGFGAVAGLVAPTVRAAASSGFSRAQEGVARLIEDRISGASRSAQAESAELVTRSDVVRLDDRQYRKIPG